MDQLTGRTPSGPSSSSSRTRTGRSSSTSPHTMPHVPLARERQVPRQDQARPLRRRARRSTGARARSWRRSKKHGLDEGHARDVPLRQRPLARRTATTAARPARCARARGPPGKAARACPFIARWPGHIPAGSVCRRAGDDDRPAADVRPADRRETARPHDRRPRHLAARSPASRARRTRTRPISSTASRSACGAARSSKSVRTAAIGSSSCPTPIARSAGTSPAWTAGPASI